MKGFSSGGFPMDNRKVILLIGAALFVGLMTGILAPRLLRPKQAVNRMPTTAMPPPSTQAVPDYSLKINELKRQLESNPYDADLLVQLGNTYFDSRQYPESIDAYEKALALKPGNPDVLTDLGVMYRRNGQPLEAVRNFRKAASISPSHPQSRMNLGIVLYYDLGDPMGAKAALEDFLRVTGNPPDAENVRSLLKEIEKSLEE
jgi:cytochrome c-type biogenesis protein CcmH/NrfG